MEIHHVNVNNAYFYNTLREEVYMTQPPSFNNSDKTIVCKLNKAIYCLKQAHEALNENLNQYLQFGFLLTLSVITPYLCISNKVYPSMFL